MGERDPLVVYMSLQHVTRPEDMIPMLDMVQITKEVFRGSRNRQVST
jgi:hypothetical protein